MTEKDASQIVLFESSDGEVLLDVQTDNETVWLNQDQMALLFDTSKQNISLHINNCFREGELEKDSVVKKSLTTARDGKAYRVGYYNLDVIISVGYRVKSQRGVEFRRWATYVLTGIFWKGVRKTNADCNSYLSPWRLWSALLKTWMLAKCLRFTP